MSEPPHADVQLRFACTEHSVGGQKGAVMYLKISEDRARKARPRKRRRASLLASHLEVRTFNVGHGEAVLVTFDNGRAWLMDCGSNTVPRNERLGNHIIDYLGVNGVVLDTIVASHPHFDHAGAIETILGSASPNVASPVTIYRTDIREWISSSGWRQRYADAVAARGADVDEILLLSAHREVTISDHASAHIYVGARDGVYTSLFVHLRYRESRLLFTGDAYCGYEVELLNAFGSADFRADVLKITHHGSSSGTAATIVNEVRPGLAIASTGDHGGHRLERDTLDRLGGRPGPRAIFETVVDGDIILRTDGMSYGGGILYEAEFESPGRFAESLGGEILRLAYVDSTRTVSDHPNCV